MGVSINDPLATLIDGILAAAICLFVLHFNRDFFHFELRRRGLPQHQRAQKFRIYKTDLTEKHRLQLDVFIVLFRFFMMFTMSYSCWSLISTMAWRGETPSWEDSPLGSILLFFLYETKAACLSP